MSVDPLIEEFLAYAQSRGIPERFRSLYRNEVVNILLQTGSAGVDQLDPAALAKCVRDAEKKVQNMKAVCVALDAFLQARGRPAASFDAAGSQPPAPTNPAEHRRYTRIPFTREIYMEGALKPGRCSDLSVGGMYLETVQVCEVGSTFGIAFSLEAGGPPIQLKAVVVFTDHGVGAGLDFVDMPPRARREIQRYISDFVAHGGNREDW